MKQQCFDFMKDNPWSEVMVLEEEDKEKLAHLMASAIVKVFKAEVEESDEYASKQ